MYFCKLIMRYMYGFDINSGDRCNLAKKGQKCNEKSHTETAYIYFDNAFINNRQLKFLRNKQFFLIILVETSNFYVGWAKMTKKGVLNQ